MDKPEGEAASKSLHVTFESTLNGRDGKLCLRGTGLHGEGFTGKQLDTNLNRMEENV
jgi:hypothetical protein